MASQTSGIGSCHLRSIGSSRSRSTGICWLVSVLVVFNVFGLNVAQTPKPCTEQKGPCACNTDDGWINLEALDTKDKNNPK